MTTIRTEDGIGLQARWDDADDGHAVVVLCHPHPLDGGTMNAPLLERVTEALTTQGFNVLRFNFRGVGSSEGAWGRGIDEIGDVAAAVSAARLAFPDLPLTIAGWSFGATTSLAWQIASRSRLPWVGIAPGIHPYRGSPVPAVHELEPAPRLVILGDRDQFASVDEMETFTGRFGATLDVLTGSDHFFYFREDEVGRLVARHLTAAVAS